MLLKNKPPPKKKKHQLQKNLEKSHESNIDLNFSQIEPPSDLEKSWVFDLQRSHLQRHQGFCLNVLPRYEGYAVLGESILLKESIATAIQGTLQATFAVVVHQYLTKKNGKGHLLYSSQVKKGPKCGSGME